MTALPARRPQPDLAAQQTLSPLRLVLREPGILHVRIDAFAVVVAIHADPALRDRTLIVGGDAQGRGAVLAASPAAREEGVRPGMTLRAAEKLCPHAVVLPADPAAIEIAAQDVLTVLGRYTPEVEPAWFTPATRRKAAVVDVQRLAQCFGATLDVHGCERLFGPPTAIAAGIGAELAAHGYTARIGVAGNPHLAAVASAVARAESTVSVPVGHEQAFLDAIPLTLLEGMDPEMLERLRALGIRVAGQLGRLPEPAVRRRFGQAGKLGHEQARGVAQRPVVAPPTPVVLEAVCNLEDPTADGLWLDRELGRLAAQLAEKLATRGQSAALLTLTVTLHGGARPVTGIFPPSQRGPWSPGDMPDEGAVRSRRLHLKQPVAGAPAILARARELLVQLAPGTPVTALRLEVTALGAAAAQLSLPLVDGKLAGHEKVEAVAQRLRVRFGPRAAYRARLVADAILPEDRVAWDGSAGIPMPRARAIDVQVDGAGYPVAVRRGRGWEPLRAICAQWRIRTNWWATPAHRHYYLVETLHGAVLELYQEQSDGAWQLTGRRD
ncbi:MAG: polymerase [Chloroflexi bacterium]|nr:polymerase [Chloroflexota bacterium]